MLVHYLHHELLGFIDAPNPVVEELREVRATVTALVRFADPFPLLLGFLFLIPFFRKFVRMQGIENASPWA